LDDWTHRLVGTKISHRSIIPPSSELHGYQLNAQDAKALSHARLIVGLSPANEPWLADWVRANGKESVMLWLQGQNDPQASADPHTWTDPSIVSILVARLNAGLNGLFTSVKTEDALKQYLTEIESLDSELRTAFSSVPDDRRKIVTQHPNLGRFAQRYQLKVFGTILESPAAEAADPSARRYSDLLRTIRQQGVRTLVVDEGQNESIARRLCQDAAIPPPVAVSFETLAPAGQPGDTWLGMMRRNALALREALLRP
jgi:zinc/manganese transport system substrate-binding protein